MNQFASQEPAPLILDFNDASFLKKMKLIIRVGKPERIEELRLLLEDQKDHPYYEILMPLILNQSE
jgi:hypothetical protein